MVKIGVLLPTREAVMYDGGGDPRPLVELARGAEALGYDYHDPTDAMRV